MPRNIVQDVIPRGQRKSIRDLSLGSSKPKVQEESVVYEEDVKKKDATKSKTKYDEDDKVMQFMTGRGEVRNGNHSRWLIWLIGIVSGMVLVFVVGNFFSGATVTISPKSEKVPINVNLVAKAKTSEGEIGYKLFTLVRDKEEIVAADGEKPVESRASGKIIVYNNYSTTPQRLVKNTRFETPDGLIYKIGDSVTIPGRRTVSGKTIAGSIEAVAYAETVGEEYNIGLTDFTIPGFKSVPERFESFYGRSKTTMTGGKVGNEKAISEEKTLQTRARLDGALTQELIAEARKQVPDDFLLFDNAYRISFEPVTSNAAVSAKGVTIREQANFVAFFINRKQLAGAIAENSFSDFDKAPVHVPNLDTLVMDIKGNVNYSA